MKYLSGILFAGFSVFLFDERIEIGKGYSDKLTVEI